MTSSVSPSALWRHSKTGNLYQIIDFCLREHDLCPSVIYCRWDGVPGPYFTRPCSEFFDGRFEQVLQKQPSVATAC